MPHSTAEVGGPTFELVVRDGTGFDIDYLTEASSKAIEKGTLLFDRTIDRTYRPEVLKVLSLFRRKWEDWDDTSALRTADTYLAITRAFATSSRIAVDGCLSVEVEVRSLAPNATYGIQLSENDAEYEKAYTWITSRPVIHYS